MQAPAGGPLTTAVTSLTRRFLESDNYESIALAVDATAVALLIALLIEQELIRAYFAEPRGIRLQAFGIIIVPLFVVFVVVVGLRASGAR